MAISTLSKKSQLVLPAKIRRQLGIEPGDRLELEVEGDHVILRKVPRSDVEALGQYRSSLWAGLAQELEKARDEWD
ncbi:MAG TPA: AbrB/MazE/SpoVT family DNA-binding domain-containing protein [Planctomycetaceae bacterium]|nr:AbrB/MazE/SpoVT family DNA-binding domain-containing protein [Planctomycetaceae bacterium]